MRLPSLLFENPLSGINTVTSPALCVVFDEGALVQLAKRQLQLLLCIHYDRPAPRDGLMQRFAAHQQKASALRTGCHAEYVSRAE